MAEIDENILKTSNNARKKSVGENETTSLSLCTSQPIAETTIELLEKDRKSAHRSSRVNARKKNKRKNKKRQYHIWTDEDDALLKRVYPHLSPKELQKLFPGRSPGAINMRADRFDIKKTEEYVSALNSANSSKLGIANFADHPLEALAQKYPDLKQAYDNILAQLLTHPSVDPNNIFVVELLKEAVLHKVTQFILMHDRIMKDLKGKQLFINSRTGLETWVEARYPHSPDITNDAQMARRILRDLGIIKEQEQKVEVLGKLRLLWEDDEADSKSPG